MTHDDVIGKPEVNFKNVLEKCARIPIIYTTSETSDQWFLPHFPVIRPDKDTTKIRAVFDAAMKYNGKSLNDTMRSGPKLQREIVDVLTRFRRAPVALSSDISEMFLQVGIREEDRKYHRFLWRDFHTECEPTIYEFQRLVFGNTASPFCSQFVIQSHAKKHATEFPEAADSVSNSMYVDDLLDSSETVAAAKNLQQQLTTLLASAGFHLRKWVSNEAAVVESIPESDRLPTLDLSKAEPTKTLGVMWESKEDLFMFRIKCPESSEMLTKRNVLSTIATIYDPLQFLAPFIIRAKMLMQEMWLAGLDWDHVLPSHLATKWKKWVSELPDLSQFTIPRPLRLADPVSVELHVFSDASKGAYAAVAYLVSSYQAGTVTSRLIASKCRVAPVKSVTIPRLELMGAVLSSRLAQGLLKVLNVDRTFFWTDSENVWYWVHNQSKDFKPFVANRIGEIHRITSPEQWHHVPGKDNPADLATRGMTAAELNDSTFWAEGPTFLKEPETSWPTSPSRNPKPVDGNERRTHTQTHATNVRDDPPIDPKRFSSFRRLCRVMAWMLRFVKNSTSKSTPKIKGHALLCAEIALAEKVWIKLIQKEAFPQAERDPTLVKLNPRNDSDGLMRMNGRLRHAVELPYDTRHPIILPKAHHVTRLIVTDVHESLGHGSGVELCLMLLRSRYWIVKGRKTVRSIIETCLKC